MVDTQNYFQTGTSRTLPCETFKQCYSHLNQRWRFPVISSLKRKQKTKLGNCFFPKRKFSQLVSTAPCWNSIFPAYCSESYFPEQATDRRDRQPRTKPSKSRTHVRFYVKTTFHSLGNEQKNVLLCYSCYLIMLCSSSSILNWIFWGSVIAEPWSKFFMFSRFHIFPLALAILHLLLSFCCFIHFFSLFGSKLVLRTGITQYIGNGPSLVWRKIHGAKNIWRVDVHNAQHWLFETCF